MGPGRNTKGAIVSLEDPPEQTPVTELPTERPPLPTQSPQSSWTYRGFKAKGKRIFSMELGGVVVG